MEYTSGQFANLMGVSLDTLRYYEKEGLIKPNRKENNHRIYTDNDINWMQFIKRLKDTGMPIKEIKKYSQLRSEGSKVLYHKYGGKSNEQICSYNRCKFWYRL